MSLTFDEYALCHQKGHWKYHCPKKGRLPATSSQQSQTQSRAPPLSTFRPSVSTTASAPIPDPDFASLRAQISQLQYMLSTS